MRKQWDFHGGTGFPIQISRKFGQFWRFSFTYFEDF